MVKSCCITGCTNSRKTHPHLKYYTIPVKPQLRDLWKKAIGRAFVDTDGKVDHSKVWSPRTNHTYICSAHFITGLLDKRLLY